MTGNNPAIQAIINAAQADKALIARANLVMQQASRELLYAHLRHAEKLWELLNEHHLAGPRFKAVAFEATGYGEKKCHKLARLYECRDGVEALYEGHAQSAAARGEDYVYPSWTKALAKFTPKKPPQDDADDDDEESDDDDESGDGDDEGLAGAVPKVTESNQQAAIDLMAEQLTTAAEQRATAEQRVVELEARIEEIQAAQAGPQAEIDRMRAGTATAQAEHDAAIKRRREAEADIPYVAVRQAHVVELQSQLDSLQRQMDGIVPRLTAERDAALARLRAYEPDDDPPDGPGGGARPVTPDAPAGQASEPSDAIKPPDPPEGVAASGIYAVWISSDNQYRHKEGWLRTFVVDRTVIARFDTFAAAKKDASSMTRTCAKGFTSYAAMAREFDPDLAEVLGVTTAQPTDDPSVKPSRQERQGGADLQPRRGPGRPPSNPGFIKASAVQVDAMISIENGGEDYGFKESTRAAIRSKKWVNGDGELTTLGKQVLDMNRQLVEPVKPEAAQTFTEKQNEELLRKLHERMKAAGDS
jgi:hypothetical protein